MKVHIREREEQYLHPHGRPWPQLSFLFVKYLGRGLFGLFKKVLQ